MTNPELIVAPTQEPVTLDQAKNHLRVDVADDDALIANLISAATIRAELVETRRQFETATYRYYAPQFSAAMYLPRPPLQSVASVEYYDTTGTLQVLDPGDYRVDPNRKVGAVYITSFPSTELRSDAVQITYDAGYAAGTPADLQAALLLMIGNWYENREDVVIGTSAAPLPMGADAILMAHRVSDYAVG